MSLTETSYGQPYPRSQAQLLVELLSRSESALRAALLGHRREGKSDLLRQVHALLFQKAEGPLPFLFSFDTAERAAGSPGERRPEIDLARARHFVATFCRQMRAFVMRQEDQLGEPLARIESELERPGLPLTLTELGREFLSIPSSEQPEFAAAMPAKFAQMDGRPLCLLLDDADLDGAGPYRSGLAHARVSWLIAGRAPLIKRIAGEQAWQTMPLESFAHGDALSLAEERCRSCEIPFARQAWENWFDVAGTSPWLIDVVMQAASAARTALDSTESFGRIYVQELTAGTFAMWLAGRWKRALTQPASGTAAGFDPKQAMLIAEQLLGWDGRDSVSAIAAATWEGLIAEEWIEEIGLMTQPLLGMLERDWLQLSLTPGRAGSSSAQAGALQAFLLRAERARQWRVFSAEVADLHHGLSRLPESAASSTASRGSKDFRLPLVCSVAVERAPAAELYWCYGFRPDWPQERRDRPEAACIYLIALCREQPPAAEVKQWSKRLHEVARTLPATVTQEAASAGLSPRYELWLALPRAASLTAVAGEKRLRWEALATLLEEKKPQPGVEVPPRLRELEARAQWLEEELATAREEFDLEAQHLSPVHPESAAPAEHSMAKRTRTESPELHSRLGLSLNLLQVSSDLLALQSGSEPAALEAIQELQKKAQQLAEMLRPQERPRPSEPQADEGRTRNPKNPSPTDRR